MAISRPHNARISLARIAARFSPRRSRAPSRESSHASPLRRAPGGSRPISASASIVLPDPDSPTMPSASPSPSVNDTSFTGRTHPSRVGSSTVSPRRSSIVAIETSYPGARTRREVLRYTLSMIAPPCPTCHGATTIAGSKPYCPRCGRQWNDKDNASIEYEFKDFTGELQRQMGNDTTRKLYEGMTVPVFYDRENPKRQIPYCATLHEVVT